jgi:DNA-directed RNA polymerase subunit H
MNPLRTTDVKDIAAVQRKHRIELFMKNELSFNPTQHEYVPQHQLLSRDQGFANLRALNTTPAQCPRILVNDIIARYYGGQVGDIFRITRWDAKTGEREITYRIVVP